MKRLTIGAIAAAGALALLTPAADAQDHRGVPPGWVHYYHGGPSMSVFATKALCDNSQRAVTANISRRPTSVMLYDGTVTCELSSRGWTYLVDYYAPSTARVYSADAVWNGWPYSYQIYTHKVGPGATCQTTLNAALTQVKNSSAAQYTATYLTPTCGSTGGQFSYLAYAGKPLFSADTGRIYTPPAV